jgi:L-asparaginase II
VTFAPPDITMMLDVVVTRGEVVESRHRVHAAVVDASGRLRMAARDPHVQTWWRSCAKPFQLMPLVARGHVETLGWGADELALACGSHGGEPEHVALAGAMLSAIGLEAGDLACGPHEPLSGRGSRLLRESGHPLTRLHNNCSGKHAAMLARAVLESWPIVGYERHAHAVQRGAQEVVGRWAGMAADAMALGVDGCGVTVFGLPLANMALAYARLGHAAHRGEDVPARIVGAMTGNPFLVGGSDRFDTLLMEACEGRVLCKIGAEGVHSLAVMEQGLGIALKVEDGAQRAQYPAVLALLAALGALPTALPDALRELTGRLVWNTRGEVVGEVGVSAVEIGQPFGTARDGV